MKVKVRGMSASTVGSSVFEVQALSHSHTRMLAPIGVTPCGVMPLWFLLLHHLGLITSRQAGAGGVPQTATRLHTTLVHTCQHSFFVMQLSLKILTRSIYGYYSTTLTTRRKLAQKRSYC